MQRAERRAAQREGRAVRTLMESDYLLGVSDKTRLGALRFRRIGGGEFLANAGGGVPALLELGRLLQSTERILRDEETDEDLRLIFRRWSMPSLATDRKRSRTRMRYTGALPSMS